MKTWIDFDDAPVFTIPLREPVAGVAVCEGMLIEGPQGWGEFSPPADCDDRRAGLWLTAAIEVGTVGWPDPLRGRVPVAATIPAVSPDRATELVRESSCRAFAVEVAAPGTTPADDIARVAAVRAAAGPDAAIRCDANGAWDPAAAVTAIRALDDAAGGLELVEQPCASLAGIATVRRGVSRLGMDVRLAADQSVRDAANPLAPEFISALRDAVDIAVLTVSPLGGVRRALRVAEICGLPCLVSAALESSLGAAGGLALAGVLPDCGITAEVGVTALLAGDTVSAGRSLVPVDGYLPVAPMPPAPDRDRLAEFAAAPQVVQRWRARLTAAQRYL